MTEAGLAKIEIAKENGSWNSLDAVEELMIPADLAQALAMDKTAESNFNNLSASSKKVFLYRINSAKRPETRAKRIAEIVSSAAQIKRVSSDR